MRDPTLYCILLFFLFLILSHQTSPQSHIPDNKIHFDNITDLPTSSIWCVLQDSKGFLWIGANDGLFRYDGRKYKLFRYLSDDVNSIGADVVRAIIEDKDGILWMGTAGGGLNEYHSAEENFTRYINDPDNSTSISSDIVFSICEDKSGVLWIGTNGEGLNMFDRQNGKFIRYKNDPEDPLSLSNNIIRSIYEDSRGNLWIGTMGGGLNKFDRIKKKFIRYTNNPHDPTTISDNDINRICADNLGTVWISTLGGGINKLTYKDDNKTPVFTHYKNNPDNPLSLNNDNNTTLLIDKNNVIWIGTWGGGLNRTVSNLNNNFSLSFISYKHDPYDQFSLNINNVNCIYEDKTGLLMVTGWGGGLQVFNKHKQFRLYRHEPTNPFSLSANGISSIYEDKTGTLWIGTWDAGLNKFDRATNKFVAYKNDPGDPNSLSDNGVSAIYEDRSGTLWIGTWNGGLNKFDRKTEKFLSYKHDPQNPKSISDDRIISIAEDQSGRLWIGTYYGGLNKVEKKSESFTNYKNIPGDPNSIGSNAISYFFLDKSGTFWIGTYGGGLVSLEPNEDKFLHYNFSNDPKKIFPSEITSLYEDKSEILWFGTGGQGLFKFNRANGKVKIYTIEDGSLSNYITGILEDHSGNLWLSSDKGLSKFNPTTEYFRHYDVEDGLQGNEFEELAYCKSITGELIFGGKNGFNIFYPDSIKDNTHIPPVFITDFYLFNKPVPIGYDSLSDRIILSKSLIECEEIELNFDDKVFSFEFAALDFHAPNKNKYAYIMEGFDKDWTYIDANYRQVTYTNLDPGEYIFRVRGSNNDGIWNEAGTSIKIIILPPWWQTSWAYLIYILLIGSIIYFAWKAQLKRIRTKHEYEMSRFEAQKLHEVDEVKSRFFTNISHEFRTPLTLILGPVKQMIEKLNEGRMKDDLGMVHRNANKLLELVNQLLDISKLESGNIKLQTVPRNIIPLLKALVLSFTSYAERKMITLKLNSFEDELIVYIDKDKIEKIITNILSNAFKFTPDGGTIVVTVKTDERNLNIIISDTGVGIPKEKISKIFDRFYQVDGSHTREQEGTGIGLSLTKELVELHKGKIEVKSEEGKGTTFTVSIPLGKEHLDVQEIIEIEKVAEGEPRQGREKAAPEYGEEFEKKIEHKVDIEFFGKESLPLLLIVEDNLDVRNYIKDNLKRKYRILEAVDGEDGWNKAVESAEGGPDLIVSDVMMPKMDGFKFCEKLKTDERTSHIPVILLTAKAAKEDKLEGYETGADEYIMKPFEPDELKARIKNLIEQRKRLHEHFRKQGLAGADQQKITSVDKKFLQKCLDVIKKHLSDSLFSVEMLAEELAMSRSVLQRKIQSLTGESPGELIRQIRLNKAVELIKHRFGNLSEIALEVGYNNPAHFSEAFKKHFGTTPSQLQQKNTNS